jgi:hypothetical protein
VAYESEGLERVGTREVRLALYKLHLSDDERHRFADDREAVITALLEREGQTVNRVVFAEEASAPIFFPPNGGAPIVAHVESPEEVASGWIVWNPL